LASQTADQSDWRTESLEAIKKISNSNITTRQSGPSSSAASPDRMDTTDDNTLGDASVEGMDADDDDIDAIVPVSDDQRRIENLIKGNSDSNRKKKTKNKFEKNLNLNWCEIQR